MISTLLNDPAALLAMVAAMLAAGALAGVISGLLGVGGGIVIVPVLFHVYGLLGIDPDIKMHLAVGTSLATIIPTSLSSIRAHRQRDAVDTGVLKSLGIAVFLGVLAGSAIAGMVQGAFLTGLFAVVATAIAAHMALGREYSAVTAGLPAGPLKYAIGLFIGGISAMLGIGGGSFSVPVLSLCGYPIRRAVGTSSAIGLIIAVPGALGFMVTGWNAGGLPASALGYVDLAGFLLIVPATVLCAPLGARIAHRINAGKLRLVFALFLLVTAARMFYSLYAG